MIMKQPKLVATYLSIGNRVHPQVGIAKASNKEEVKTSAINHSNLAACRRGKEIANTIKVTKVPHQKDSHTIQICLLITKVERNSKSSLRQPRMLLAMTIMATRSMVSVRVDN